MRHRLCAFLMLLLLFIPGFASAGLIQPFISEIHYDNAGTDVDEFVEITGSQANLDGWLLRFYNGANGLIYRTQALEGLLQGDGLAALVFFPSFSIQNGPADGLALVDPLGRVVEFLSYEGSLVASGGEAAGLSAFNLPASQNNSTAIGLSLQRHGLLRENLWQVAVASPGQVNAGLVPTASTLALLFIGFAAAPLARKRRVTSAASA